MIRQLIIAALSVGLFAYSFSSCRHEPFDPLKGNYPAEVSRILVYKCSYEGCHDAAGAVHAAALRLDDWSELFKGSSHGAVVVPYSTRYSSLLYYINREGHANDDVVAIPTMPYNAPPLSEEEYNTLKNWIANGAPDAAGNIAFADGADTRQKIYITQQDCNDHVAVIDGKSGLTMRYIPVGITNNGEKVHNVKVSADGRYAYVCFSEGEVVQKIDTRIDEVVGTVNIGKHNWNVLKLSPDGNKLLVTGTGGNTVAIINTAGMSVESLMTGLFIQPHGIAASPDMDTLYISRQSGNFIYRYIVSQGDLGSILLSGNEEVISTIPGLTPDPHEIAMSSDNRKLFVTAQNNNKVYVVDIATMQVSDSIAVGRWPQEMAVSRKRGLLFITCQEDANNKFNEKSNGSVYVVDMNTNRQVGGPLYGDFYQPHGIAIDEQNDVIYIISRNNNEYGPAPHHSSGCGGRNGWYTLYGLNTLLPVNGIRYEIINDPYSAEVRFK